MDKKYKPALRIGIIGGLVTPIPMILSLLALITSFNMGDLFIIFNFTTFIVYIVVTLGCGLLAVHFTRPLLHNFMDVIEVAGSAGAINGIIFSVILSIVSLIWPYLGTSTPNSNIVFSVASSPIYIPFYIVFSAAMNSFIAIIGGTLYTIPKVPIKLTE